PSSLSALSLHDALPSSIVKQELAEPGPFHPLQKLFWNNLVGIHVGPVQRYHFPAVFGESFHRNPSLVGSNYVALRAYQRSDLIRSEEHTSELQSREHLV